MLNCNVPLTPHNLLDNSNFRNPVNQRGRTEASGNGYFIDRWGNYNGTSKVVSSGIQVNANKDSAAFLYQYIKALRDGTYTFAAKVNGNIVLRVIQISGATVTSINGDKAAYTGGYLVVIYANDDKFEFDFRVESGATITVEWAALYEGAYDASTLPAYQPKGYAAELAECKRYYQTRDISNYKVVVLGEELYFAIEHPDMRIAPSITIINPIANENGSITNMNSGGKFATEIRTITKDRTIVYVATGTSGKSYGVSYTASADL